MTNKKIPMRMCVGCGQMKSKQELIRIIKTSEDEVLLDLTGKKNGRGAYLCKNVDCFRKARKSKGLERSLKKTIPDAIYDNMESELSLIEG